jgi:cell division protein FtsB
LSTATRARRSPEPKRAPRPVVAARRPGRPSLAARIVRISTVVVVFFAVLVLFGLVAFHALIVRNQTRIDTLDAEIAEATRARQELHLAVAQLEAPDRIRAEAIGRLGMIQPAEVIYLEPLPAEVVADVVPDDEAVTEGAVSSPVPSDEGGAAASTRAID